MKLKYYMTPDNIYGTYDGIPFAVRRGRHDIKLVFGHKSHTWVLQLWLEKGDLSEEEFLSLMIMWDSSPFSKYYRKKFEDQAMPFKRYLRELGVSKFEMKVYERKTELEKV